MTYMAYWGDKPRNFGDVLNANLFRYYGIDYTHTNNSNKANLFAIGSVIRLAKKSVVLGSGIIKEGEKLDPENKYEFVRGPLTRQRILECGGECPEIYGDPALLLPKFCPPVEKDCEIGFVPHYVHKNPGKLAAKENGWKYIDVVNHDPLEVARQISACEKIVSTSLHGIIAAHAYGIPAAHIRLAKVKDLHGDGSKFADYYASVNLLHRSHSSNDPIFEVGDIPDLTPIEIILDRYADD